MEVVCLYWLVCDAQVFDPHFMSQPVFTQLNKFQNLASAKRTVSHTIHNKTKKEKELTVCETVGQVTSMSLSIHTSGKEIKV